MTKVANPTSRRLLRLKPASEYLSLSPGYLRRLIQRGEVPVVRLDDSGHSPWLVDVRDLDVWIERTKVNL
jgi:excisionase family DNA binding protein